MKRGGNSFGRWKVGGGRIVCDSNVGGGRGGGEENGDKREEKKIPVTGNHFCGGVQEEMGGGLFRLRTKASGKLKKCDAVMDGY